MCRYAYGEGTKNTPSMVDLNILQGIRECLHTFSAIRHHSVCETDIETIEIAMCISEDDSDILHEMIDRVCLLLNVSPNLPRFAIVTSYIEHDFPTLTHVYVEADSVIIRTESQLDHGATYRRRMSVA